jgi:heme-degrading monooxygenase HmoA
MLGTMTVIKINALTVPAEMGEEVARRFAARAGAVDGQEGFEGFELLKPVDDRTTWLVVTRWRDDASFEAWRTSPAFGQGHRSEGGDQPAGQGHPGAGQGHPGGHPGGAPQAGGQPGGGQQPLPIQAELWSYEVAVGSKG